MERDSFVFYKSFYESLVGLDNETKLNILLAICDYSLFHKENKLTGVAKSLFTLIKPQLEANYKKWMNGCKGGVQKGTGTGNQNAKKYSTDEETKNEPKTNLKRSKNEGNENVNVNVNENVNVNGFDSKEINHKPSIKDISIYCNQKGYKWDIERFYEHYNQYNFLNQYGNPIDWKAQADKWIESKKKMQNIDSKDIKQIVSSGLEL